MKESRSQLEHLPLRQLGDQGYRKTECPTIPRLRRACLEKGMLGWRPLGERNIPEYSFRRPCTQGWANTQRSQLVQGKWGIKGRYDDDLKDIIINNNTCQSWRNPFFVVFHLG